MSIDSDNEVHVLAGVIFDVENRMLLAQRPEGKDLAGLWEFPGGKIEPGETRLDALRRELREELGIEITQARPLTRITHTYPHRRVLLDFWIVRNFNGKPRGLDGQALRWCASDKLNALELLPANRPVVRLACLPDEIRTERGTNYEVLADLRPGTASKLTGVLCRNVDSAVAAASGSTRADFIVMTEALPLDLAARLCCQQVPVPVFLQDVALSVAWDLGASGVSHLRA